MRRRPCVSSFTFLIVAFRYNVTWIQNWSRWESVSLDINRDHLTHANEKALICDSINASAREIIGNKCRGYPQRVRALFWGFNDIDDVTISRSAIITVTRLPLFSGCEQVGIWLNSAFCYVPQLPSQNSSLITLKLLCDDSLIINAL